MHCLSLVQDGRERIQKVPQGPDLREYHAGMEQLTPSTDRLKSVGLGQHSSMTGRSRRLDANKKTLL